MNKYKVFDLEAGQTDGYGGNWSDGAGTHPVTPDMRGLGGKKTPTRTLDHLIHEIEKLERLYEDLKKKCEAQEQEILLLKEALGRK